MDKDTIIDVVKARLDIADTSRDLLISDIYDNAIGYMNLPELPNELEPLIRAKVQGIMNYEAQFGEGNMLDVTAQTEGKCSWTYNINGDNCREGIYGFTTRDFQQLKRYRVTRK